MTRLIALLLAGVFAAPMIIAAHEGHDHKLMGVVSMVHENHLEVKDKAGAAKTFTLATADRIGRDKAIIKGEAIKDGDRVVVTGRETKDKSGKGTVTVREVQLGTAAVAVKK